MWTRMKPSWNLRNIFPPSLCTKVGLKLFLMCDAPQSPVLCGILGVLESQHLPDRFMIQHSLGLTEHSSGLLCILTGTRQESRDSGPRMHLPFCVGLASHHYPKAVSVYSQQLKLLTTHYSVFSPGSAILKITLNMVGEPNIYSF